MYRGYQEQLLREKQPAPKRRWKKKKVFLITFVILFFVTGCIMFIRAPFMQVADIEVIGVSATDPGDVRHILETSMSGERLLFIPKTSILFLGERRLVEKLKAEFPRLSAVSIQKVNFHSILVSIQEYEEWALWCDTRGSSENCYFMDLAGAVFSPAPFFSGTAYVKVYKGNVEPLPFEPLE